MNKLSKNAQKFGESGVIVGISTFAAHGLCGLLNLPDSSVPALTVLISAILAGVYNLITHLPIAWPLQKKSK